jgi:hypothetical protein
MLIVGNQWDWCSLLELLLTTESPKCAAGRPRSACSRAHGVLDQLGIGIQLQLWQEQIPPARTTRREAMVADAALAAFSGEQRRVQSFCLRSWIEGSGR